MLNSVEQIQIFYEISMEIGMSSDIYGMSRKVLSLYIKKLNCSSGGVFQYCKANTDLPPYQLITSIPRRLKHCQSVLSNYLDETTSEKLEIFIKSLPITCIDDPTITGYVMDLPGFGFIVLIKSGEKFDNYTLNSIRELNNKFANALVASTQNTELVKSENKFRGIFETVKDVFFQTDNNGIIREISPSIEAHSGYTVDELLNKSVELFYSNKEDFNAVNQSLNDVGEVVDFTIQLRTQDGRDKYVSVNAHVVLDENDQFTGILGTLRDVTERKIINEQLIINERNQRIINYFATSLAGSNTVDEILWDITYNCISQLDLEDCVVYLVNDSNDLLVQSAAYGSQKEKDYTILNPITLQMGEGIVGSVAVSQKSEIIDDVSKDKRYIMDDESRGSELTVPIVYENKLIGIIDSEHSEKCFFHDSHLQIFEAIASLAANKIMRAISLEKIKESEAAKAAIVDTALDCIISIDDKGKITDFNPAAENTFGHNKTDILGKNIKDTIIPHGFRDGHSAGMAKYNKTGHGPILGKRIEIIALHSKGHEFPIELTVTPVKLGERQFFTAYLRDISVEKEAARQMKLQSDTLEAAANGIIITDIKGIIIWANPAFMEMTGFSKKELIGKSTRMLSSGQHEKEYYEDLWNTILSGKVWHGEIINRRKDKSTYTEEMTITPVQNESGVTSNFIAIKQDISDRKKAEQVLRDSERMKTNFVSNVSHELRTPLASILGFSGTIIRDKNMKPETKDDFIKIIFDESQRLTRLIENVLDISRIESGTISFIKQPSMIGAILEEVIESQEIMARKKNIKLHARIGKKLPVINASPDGLKQVAVNLISNAIKFTDENGEINVSLSEIDDKIRLIVQDSGIGIPEEDIEKIFDKFYRVQRDTRQDQGTGIGLAIVNEIIKQHNGTIKVSSKVGSGTTFEILLPMDN